MDVVAALSESRVGKGDTGWRGIARWHFPSAHEYFSPSEIRPINGDDISRIVDNFGQGSDIIGHTGIISKPTTSTAFTLLHRSRCHHNVDWHSRTVRVIHCGDSANNSSTANADNSADTVHGIPHKDIGGVVGGEVKASDCDVVPAAHRPRRGRDAVDKYLVFEERARTWEGDGCPCTAFVDDPHIVITCLASPQNTVYLGGSGIDNGQLILLHTAIVIQEDSQVGDRVEVAARNAQCLFDDWGSRGKGE